jgi:hypothetical protein
MITAELDFVLWPEQTLGMESSQPQAREHQGLGPLDAAREA